MKTEISEDPLKKKSLFLSPDKIDEWNAHFHFIPREVRDLILKRNTLRMQRLFEQADKIKADVWGMGYGVRDSQGHVHIYVRRTEWV